MCMAQVRLKYGSSVAQVAPVWLQYDSCIYKYRFTDMNTHMLYTYTHVGVARSWIFFTKTVQDRKICKTHNRKIWKTHNRNHPSISRLCKASHLLLTFIFSRGGTTNHSGGTTSHATY